jgi:hypothetical protein
MEVTVGLGGRTHRARKHSADKREWVGDHGFHVADRGRLSDAAEAAYQAAHAD